MSICFSQQVNLPRKLTTVGCSTHLPPKFSTNRRLAGVVATVLGLGGHVNDQRSGRREQGQGEAPGHRVVVFDREGPLALVGDVFGVVAHLLLSRLRV